MTFDTKIAYIVRDDLATWQRLNVVAFLATGIASAAPDPRPALYRCTGPAIWQYVWPAHADL